MGPNALPTTGHIYGRPSGSYGSTASLVDRQQSADSVEKVAPPSGLRQNSRIGQQGSTQHDGTVIEWAGATVLLVQP